MVKPVVNISDNTEFFTIPVISVFSYLLSLTAVRVFEVFKKEISKLCIQSRIFLRNGFECAPQPPHQIGFCLHCKSCYTYTFMMYIPS